MDYAFSTKNQFILHENVQRRSNNIQQHRLIQKTINGRCGGEHQPQYFLLNRMSSRCSPNRVYFYKSRYSKCSRSSRCSRNSRCSRSSRRSRSSRFSICSSSSRSSRCSRSSRHSSSSRRSSSSRCSSSSRSSESSCTKST
jgi:hypothetical protein